MAAQQSSHYFKRINFTSTFPRSFTDCIKNSAAVVDGRFRQPCMQHGGAAAATAPRTDGVDGRGEGERRVTFFDFP